MRIPMNFWFCFWWPCFVLFENPLKKSLKCPPLLRCFFLQTKYDPGLVQPNNEMWIDMLNSKQFSQDLTPKQMLLSGPFRTPCGRRHNFHQLQSSWWDHGWRNLTPVGICIWNKAGRLSMLTQLLTHTIHIYIYGIFAPTFWLFFMANGRERYHWMVWVNWVAWVHPSTVICWLVLGCPFFREIQGKKLNQKSTTESRKFHNSETLLKNKGQATRIEKKSTCCMLHPCNV